MLLINGWQVFAHPLLLELIEKQGMGKDLPAIDDKHGSESDFAVDLFTRIDFYAFGQRCNPGHKGRR